MAPQEIERVAMPARDDFFREYVYRHRPVVVTGVFAGQPLGGIRTLDDAVQAWGCMQLQVQEEYVHAERTGAPTSPTFMSFAGYIDHTRSNPSTRLCCTEYETPARVLATFTLPPPCRLEPPTVEEVFALPRKYGDHDLATNTFVANAGNVAHLHFDGDQREVLLHQVYGRKRVILFPPTAARCLRTLDGPPSRPSLSGVDLEHMSPDDRCSFVEAAGGCTTVLEPGDTLYVPMLAWHHFEYLDDAMSVSVRFGRNRLARFLSLDHFHRDPFVQNVASTMTGPDTALDAVDPVVQEIMAVYERPAPDIEQKIREVRARFRRLAAQRCPDAHPADLCPPEREEEQIERIARSRDLQGGMKYAHPAVIARSRPVGPMTERQRSIIRDGIARCGYTEDVERAVLGNRVGKADLDELTKAEAAQTIAYLTTPGATW